MPSLPSVPFPSDTPTHDLVVIDYARLAQGDPSESHRLFEAATSLGFFYLKDHPIDYHPLFELCEEVFKLDDVDKEKYDVGHSGSSFGYKAVGTDNVDEAGNVDTNEQFNISRDDALSYPEVTHIEYPQIIKDGMSAMKTFTSQARSVSMTLLAHFERHLELPPGALTSLHQEGPGKASPTKARVIRNPPQDKSSTLALGSHTDFGSITLLNNNMTGGLQVLAPGTDAWQFIKPLEGHIICNLADALVVLSGGILRSNLHRVLPPPGEQRACTRWSGIFFHVPDFATILEPLASQSKLIAEAAPRMPSPPAPGTTCQQWFHRRLFGIRAVNRTGPESWLGSRGTEHVVVEGHSARAPAQQLQQEGVVA